MRSGSPKCRLFSRAIRGFARVRSVLMTELYTSGIHDDWTIPPIVMKLIWGYELDNCQDFLIDAVIPTLLCTEVNIKSSGRQCLQIEF